ncbi:MAG: hypothetical protein RL758_659 [Pseudomonadota bacterium]|jgi:hypothetical protein
MMEEETTIMERVWALALTIAKQEAKSPELKAKPVFLNSTP